MTGQVIIVLAVVAGIAWLGVMLISALRNRGGGEEVPNNLQPGIDDQHLETRRLEKGQKAAIAFSAFLAISLPLYFLGETNRQEGFVEEFHTESVQRGEHIVEEFKCFTCHGPLGSGGSAPYVEKRSGVSVGWTAPSLDDVLFRYDRDEVTFWITYGRPNTPMPPWGVAGGGALNVHQIEDIVNYLETIQIPQQQAVDEVNAEIPAQIARLDGADDAVATAILNQRQVLAEIAQAPADSAFITPLVDDATATLHNADEGIDTDGDGVSDTAEAEISDATLTFYEHFRAFDPPTLDPNTPDAQLADQGLADLAAAALEDPVLEPSIASIEAALAGDQITADNPDTDGDGISDAVENQISALFSEASEKTVPNGFKPISLDPTNPETVTGTPDLQTATEAVGSMDTVEINLGVTATNQDKIETQQSVGLDYLRTAQEAAAWRIDIDAVAQSMGTSRDTAERAVGLFNTNCARCHTAGFSAGVIYTEEAGSGALGPALWEGRPVVQFGEGTGDPQTDLLIDFIIKGSQAQQAYGYNGMGTGRMPAFGAILPLEDIELLAQYIRSGNMAGRH